MLTLCAIKLMSAVALTVGLHSPALASELKLVTPDAVQTSAHSESGQFAETWQSISEYKIDESPRPVVVGWNAENPTAFLIAVHGFGLHKGAFEQFALAMKDRSVSTYSLDVRGFGGWATKQKKALSFSETSEDISALVESIRRDHPGKPIFLIGESMGGAIALDYSAQHPGSVDGVISSVPGTDRFGKVRTALKVGASYVLTGGHSVNLKHILVERVFHNKQLQRNWQSDPEAKLSFRLGDLLSLTKFMKQAQASATQIHSTPVLMVQGVHDRLVKPQSSERIFGEIRTSDKQLIEVAQGEHLTFEDGQFDDKVVSQVESWLASHSNAPILSASAN
jgi:acylglycerol lipase